jgi:GT2 family glycosyltransferase
MPDPSADVPAALGVVVLNWNGATDTIACLDSLWNADPRPARVVIVENHSADDSLVRLEAHSAARGIPTTSVTGAAAADIADVSSLEWLTIVVLCEHRGFAGGNNVGLRLLARCDDVTHFLLLNNDTEVAPDYFAHMTDAVAAAPDAGLLSGTIYHWEPRDRVWWAGGRSVGWRALVLHDDQVPHSATPVATEFITGCALVISRRALDRVGLLAECYFPIYVEDAEYSYRARRLGLPVLYAPLPVVYHKIGATAGRANESAGATYLDIKHRAFYVRRNFTGAERVMALAYIAATKPARAVKDVLRGRPDLARAVLRGTVHGLFGRGAWATRVPGT